METECYNIEGIYADDFEDEGWEAIMCLFEDILDEAEYGIVLDGTAEVWHGEYSGGFYAYDLEDMLRQISKYDLAVRQEGRRLFVELIHHDGRHRMELRKVTKRGFTRIENNYGLSPVDYAKMLSKSKSYTKNALSY